MIMVPIGTLQITVQICKQTIQNVSLLALALGMVLNGRRDFRVKEQYADRLRSGSP